MKKTLAVALMIGLIAASFAVPAEAGKKKKKKAPAPAPVARVERVVELTYEHPSLAVAPVGGFPTNFPEGGTEIPLGPDDLFIKVEVTDASGQKVSGFIGQGDIDGNGVNDDGYGQFCGAHPAPIQVAAPGQTIIGIYLANGVCEDATPSIMTTGSIKVTLSNMP
ncbi:MAG TPA: hypothetical protein VNP73_09300 [Actinomycetota bacterium]|nr:hypothetical protein [Actinomycetota bacterium]